MREIPTGPSGAGVLVAVLLGVLLFSALPAHSQSVMSMKLGASTQALEEGPSHEGMRLTPVGRVQSSSSTSSWADEETGFFCSSCTSDASARQLAVNAVPPPECDWGPHGHSGEAMAGARDYSEFRRMADQNLSLDPRDMPECGAPIRQVVIGNHDTYQLFAYIVGWNQDAWAYTIVQDVTLDPDQIEGYERLIDFRLHWVDFLSQPITLSEVDVNALPLHLQDRGTTDCPSNTVLDHVLYPAAEQQVKGRMKDLVTDNVADFQENTPWVTGGTIGVILRHMPFTFNWSTPSQGTANTIRVDGPENEYGELGDHLFYDVDLAGVSADGGGIMVSFDRLDQYSTVLGHSLDFVLSGQMQVEDNPCVRDKLADLAYWDGEGEWRNRSGERIDQSRLRGPMTAPGPMCYVDFYSDGQLLYTFRVDCNRAR